MALGKAIVEWLGVHTNIHEPSPSNTEAGPAAMSLRPWDRLSREAFHEPSPG